MENLANGSWIKSSPKLSEYQKALLSWYETSKRHLPWRHHPSLYKTVVSEFMLQQTRVTTVLPYFESWINKFPTFKDLADAPESQVLKAWEGLGYYSRARNLHLLAKIASAWKTPPVDLNNWLNLPGVGPYIAAAVTSISFAQPEAVCDGNVVRVLSRVFAIPEIFKDGATAQKKIRPLAQILLSKSNPGDYNQAMMELGATRCHPVNPRCGDCPLSNRCEAGQKGQWQKYPVIVRKSKKTAIIRRYWIENQDSLLLFASSQKRLHGVYELPTELPLKSGYKKSNSDIVTIRKRTVGNVEYTEEIHQPKTCPPLQTSLPEGYVWMKWQEFESFTLSGPHRRWIAELKS
jgi:A/G-specific adenine glycosylase